jgi:predicted HicB family RNase H-like nuclease
MINAMTLDGYTAVISYGPDSERFRGSMQGLNDGADFFGTNPEELRQESRASLNFVIETCS